MWQLLQLISIILLIFSRKKKRYNYFTNKQSIKPRLLKLWSGICFLYADRLRRALKVTTKNKMKKREEVSMWQFRVTTFYLPSFWSRFYPHFISYIYALFSFYIKKIGLYIFFSNASKNGAERQLKILSCAFLLHPPCNQHNFPLHLFFLYNWYNLTIMTYCHYSKFPFVWEYHQRAFMITTFFTDGIQSAVQALCSKRRWWFFYFLFLFLIMHFNR